MKLSTYFANNNTHRNRIIFIISSLFTLGIIIGTIYLIYLPDNSSQALSIYLNKYFNNVKTNTSYRLIFKNSIINYLKSFIIIYISSFVRPGIVTTSLCVMSKGFSMGFCTSAFIHHYKLKGILIPIGSLISDFLYIPALILFASFSISASLNAKNRENSHFKQFTLLSICTFTIFCISALLNCTITTTFMKLISSFFVKP